MNSLQAATITTKLRCEEDVLQVPEGGFLPAEIRRSPQSVSGVASSIDDDSAGVNEDEVKIF